MVKNICQTYLKGLKELHFKLFLALALASGATKPCLGVSEHPPNPQFQMLKIDLCGYCPPNYFSRSAPDLPFKIVLFTDATFGNLSDGGSQGGHVIFLVDKHSKSNLISWQSKHIKCIVHSTLATEKIIMMDGIESAVYISALLKEFHPQLNNIPIEISMDNNSLHDTLRSQKCF